MQRLTLALAALVIIGAGCVSSEKVAVAPYVPPAAAPTPAAPAKAEPSDVRVVQIDAKGNAAGIINENGCDGPRVDMVIKLQNFGPDYPDAAGLEKVKEINDSQQGQFGAVPWEESELFRVSGEVWFGDKGREFIAQVKPGDLPGGKLRTGQTMDLRASVLTPCCDPLPPTMKLKANILQSSSLIPTGQKGMKEFYEAEAELALPDVTPGHGQLLIKNGKGVAMVDVENVGKVPTAGPITVQVAVPRKDSSFSAAVWEGRYEQPFTGTVRIGPMNVTDVVGQPDQSKVKLSVMTLCPSEVYDPIHDANPQNDNIVRDVTVTESSSGPGTGLNMDDY